MYRIVLPALPKRAAGVLGALVLATGAAHAADTACPADGLARLGVAGLAPAFSPGIHDYRLADPPGESVDVTAAPCDPSVSLYVGGNPLTAGRTTSVWTGSGGADLVLYRNW